MNDRTGKVQRDEWQPPAGLKRTLTVALDPAQYQADMAHMAAHKSEDVYSSFNLLMRRKPKARPAPRRAPCALDPGPWTCGAPRCGSTRHAAVRVAEANP